MKIKEWSLESASLNSDKYWRLIEKGHEPFQIEPRGANEQNTPIIWLKKPS